MRLSKAPSERGLPAKPGGGEPKFYPVPPAAPPRAGAEAGPYTAPSYVAELPALLHVCIHIMEKMPLYVQKRGIFIFSEKILLRVQ